MFCVNCGKEVSANDAFCPHCGTEIPRIVSCCPNCSIEMPDDVNFCPNCGTEASREETNQHYNESKNLQGLSKVFFSVVGFIFLLFLLMPIIVPMLSYESSSSPELTLKESYGCTLDYGVKAICGTIENNSSKDFSYIQIKINLYDDNGQLIGNAMDNATNIETNSSWKFKAVTTDDNYTSYKIKSISAF